SALTWSFLVPALLLGGPVADGLQLFFAELVRDGLAFSFGFFANTHFFADASLFLNDGFLAAKRDVYILALERFFSGSCLRCRNAFDLDLFAFEFHVLLSRLSADDLAQPNAARFDLTFAYFKLFLRALDTH